ncbi:fasciclin domain-containing protein [Nonlabens marinus]
MNLKNNVLLLVMSMFLLVGSQVSAQVETIGKPVMVGGEEMNPAKNIIENASKSKAHKTLVAAIKAAGLVETLSGAGPFTVFAPTNTAFSALPDGTLETLLKPENKEQLIQLLTFHVIPGKINSTDLIALMDKNNGRASIATIEGGKLTFYMEDGDVYLKDEKGKNAAVTIADVNQSNGVIHVIDAVLTPKK